MTIGVALAAALVMSAPNVDVFRMPDGIDVVLYRVPKAEEVALRVMVRVGAANDPYGKNGIAHMLEHMVFHGSYALGGAEFRARLAEGGGRYNAMTSLDYTYYILDAPKHTWRRLAADYLDVLTNPALTLADRHSELGVIDSEALLFAQKSLFWLADLVLFPSNNKGSAPIIGTRRTRRNITAEDLVRLYRQNYIPTNVTVLVVGDVDREAISSLLTEHVHWPPMPKQATPKLERLEMNIPIDQSIVAYPPAVLFGYAVPDLDGLVCHQLAELLQLRLTVDLVGRRALASQVIVQCTKMRGRRVLLAATFSRSYESGLVPDAMARAFERAKDRLASAEERTLLKRRSQARLQTDVEHIADYLVPVIADPPSASRRRQLRAMLKPRAPDAAALRRAARKAFSVDRRILLYLNPFKR